MEETLANPVFQPPAISPAKPVPPNENSKPYPTPFSSDNSSSNNISEDVAEKCSASENPKPYPTPFSENSSTINISEYMTEDFIPSGNFRPYPYPRPFPLNKARYGRINKRKKMAKMFKAPPVVAVSKSERKDIANAKLRRVIYPKTPVWILRELAMELNTEEIYSYSEPVDEIVEGQNMKLIPCEVQINGGIYYGSGPDQEISQMLAAENAIQGLTAQAITGAPPNAETSDPLDNAPWAALASLGLFKLFNDWQNRGFGLPLHTTPSAMSAGRAVEHESSSQVARSCKNMPEDPTSKHPVSLLNEVFPGTPMTCTINQEKDQFEMSACIQGKTFVGVGRSKKEAKKLCAMEALKELKNIDYSDTSGNQSW